MHVPRSTAEICKRVGSQELWTFEKQLTLGNWKFGQVQIKKSYFFKKIFGKLEIENYDKLNETYWLWKVERIQ